MKYVFYKELQQYMTSYFSHTGNTLSFAQALRHMNREGFTHDGELPVIDSSYCNLDSTEDICSFIDNSSVIVTTNTMDLEENSSLQESMIVFKYPSHSKAGIHVQDGIEFNYVYSGSFHLYFEGNTYTIHENEVVIIPPNTYHDVLDTDGSIVFSFLIHQDYFNDTFFQVIRKDSPLSTFYDLSLYHYAKTFLKFRIAEPRKFLNTFLLLYSEFTSDANHNHDICINYIRILFAYLLRQPVWNFEHDKEDNSLNMVNNLPAILQYIKQNYLTVSLNSLADHFHYDRSYLGKLIKKYTRSSFTDLVTNYRLGHAASLLLNTNKRIEDIAEESGYQSADHLSRMFKAKYGASPSIYRKMQK